MSYNPEKYEERAELEISLLEIRIVALKEALNEACDIASGECLDETWDREQNKRTLARIEELRKVGE